MPRNLLIQTRRDSAANWTSVNPVLGSGEFGFENEGRRVKVGDGSTPWTSLRYLPDIINDNGVLTRMLRDSLGTSVIGRPVASTGDPSDIRALTDGHILKRLGSTLVFDRVGTQSFADGAVTTQKIADGTIADIKISNSAELSPSKLGPGFLPTRITADTPNYVEDSVTVDKLSRLKNSEGVAVWLDYDARCYRIDLKGSGGFSLNFGGANPITGVFGYWPISGAPTWTIGFPITGGGGSSRVYYSLDSEAYQYHKVQRIYSKYAVINNTCYVSALFDFVEDKTFRSVLNFTLPFIPEGPEGIIVGSAYHLRSNIQRYSGRGRDSSNNERMRPIIPILEEDNMITFLGYRSPNDLKRDWDQAVKGYHYGPYGIRDRIAFNIRYEIKPGTIAI